MRLPTHLTGFALALLLSLPASAVSIDWVTVGLPGNACETQLPSGAVPGGCFGAVAETYLIGKYEVTNAQYAEFLNAVADSDANGLYNTNMGLWGISRIGSPGSFTYDAISGREQTPVNFVSFYDALRFANWLHNGQPMGAQGNGTTEDGSYTITSQGITTNSITRNAGATIFLPSEDEWYKAAYHNAIGLAATDYFDYPAGFNAQTTCAAPGATANTANCNGAVDDLTDVGSYTGSASPWGTFDQGGNVFEWNEAVILATSRGTRGGNLSEPVSRLAASNRSGAGPGSDGGAGFGFRIAAVVPEPGTEILVTGGLLALASWRRRRVIRE